MEKNARVEKIKKRLFEKIGKEAKKIDIKFVGDKAILTGSVDSAQQRKSVDEAVWEFAGVEEIENRIVVVPQENIADKVVADNILVALKGLGVDLDNITVKVEDGTVSLVGEVGSSLERRQVYSEVLGINGVLEVYENLSIAS